MSRFLILTGSLGTRAATRLRRTSRDSPLKPQVLRAATQHPREASGSWRAAFSLSICLDLLHQFASGWTEDAVFNVPHSRQTSQQLRRIKGSLFLRFYPGNLGSLSTKGERLACRPACPLSFSLCVLSLNVPLCPRCP